MPGRGNSLSKGPEAGTGLAFSRPSKEASVMEGTGGETGLAGGQGLGFLPKGHL